ncbi:MAG: hypothetical protein RLY97_1721 [Pseudomonadota bacterium]|jgi:hypothetical protein
MPRPDAMVKFRAGSGQRFLMTVDTEEEFDWTKPFGRTSHAVDTIPRLRKFQQFCESYGVVPVYLVDYPIANSPMAAEVLNQALAAGKAEVGIQLHPWVNPPHEEEVCEFNSFSGNLPYDLERAKLFTLRDTIIKNFKQIPLIYRAGRYGTGPNTGKILRDAGVAIDTSARARFDYSGTGGPNYRGLPIKPWWVDGSKSLMELPLTTVFWGPLRKYGSWLYPMLWRWPRLRGALAKFGLLERIPMTPEGVTINEAIRGLDIAIEEQLPIIILSFHSPSLYPGFTPYVRDEADLDDLYAWWRTIFDYLTAHGVRPTSVKDIMQSVELA